MCFGSVSDRWLLSFTANLDIKCNIEGWFELVSAFIGFLEGGNCDSIFW